MGRTLLRANLRRRIRRRSRPCSRFCSCCDDNTNTKKSSASSLHKKREAAKKHGSGRILKATKKTSIVEVKPSNGRKPNRLKRLPPGRTNSVFNSQLKKVLVNVTRLSEDVLRILSEFGSICACEVDPGSTSCHSDPISGFVRSPYLTAPVRRLRSTPIVPVGGHMPSTVMDRLRVLNADWRCSTYPTNDNTLIPSKAPENIPLTGINMKTLFLQNLSICKKAPNDESSKENVKVPQRGIRPGGNLELAKDIEIPSSAVDCLPVTRETATTRKKAMSKTSLPSSPSKIQAPPSQSTWPQKQRSWPTILGVKPMRGNSKFVDAENISNRNSDFVPYRSLLVGSTCQTNANVKYTKQSMTVCPGISPTKSDSKCRGVVLVSPKRGNTAVRPRDKPQGVRDSGSTPKKQKIQDKDITRNCATTPRTNDIPTSKTPPGKNQVHTIVLSDSSDDEPSYVLVDKVAPPKHAAQSNTGKKKPSPKRKSATKVLVRQKNSRPAVSLRNQCSDERSSKNKNHSKPKVQVKKAIQRKNSSIKKSLRAKVQISDLESEECCSSDSEPKVVETPAKRVRGNWKGGCRSCPGCKIDVPRKKQSKQVPVRKKVRPKRMSHPTDSDSSIEIVNIIPRKGRQLAKPESPPPVIIHGLTSSNDSLDEIQDEQSLGHGRTALVFVTEPPGCEISVGKTLPPTENTGKPTNPEQVLDVDELIEIGGADRSPNIHGQNKSVQRCGEASLPATNPPQVDPINDGKPTFHSSHNLLEQQQHAHDQSVLRITDALSSQENSTNLEIRQPDDLAMDTTACVPNVDSGVKDGSGTQLSVKINNSQSEAWVTGISSSSPGDLEHSHNIVIPESQCNEKCGDLSLEVDRESLDSSIAIENVDYHDYSESNSSPLSSLGSKDIFDQAGIEKGQDLGPDISPQTSELEWSKPVPEQHHEVLVQANDSQEANNCTVLSNAMSGVHNRCKQEKDLENEVLENSMTPEVSRAIPSAHGMQTLQSEVMSDAQSSVLNDCVDAPPDESSIASHAFPAHDNMCEGPTTSNHIMNISNFVPTPSIEPFSELDPTPQGDVTENNVLHDKDSHSTFELPCTSIGSEEACLKSTKIPLDIVPDTITIDQGCEVSSGSDDVLRHTDQLNEPSSGITQYFDNNPNVATSSERQHTDNQAPPEHQSQESISTELSHLLDDIVKSVKLDNREVIIRKANLESSETMGEPAVTTEPGSDESALVAKELNLLVPLNPRLMIKKLPISNYGSSAYPQDIHFALNDHKVPEDRRCNTPDMTTPSKSFYEHKGYPSPIKRLNPGVLSVIKYSDLEIDNDEPPLNDPPETDLVECVSSKGVRFALNPEDLPAIEDFLKVRPPEDEAKEVDSNHTVDDLLIDNDEPPLNPSPLKRGKHPSPLPENEEDLEDLVIDNDAPPLNESAEAVIEVKPVPHDSDCLIISSDDEVCTSSAANSLPGKIPGVKTSSISPSKNHPRLKKKLFRIRRSSAVDSVRNSTSHNKGNLNSRLKLPRVEPLGFPRVVNQEVFDAGEDVLSEIVVNDCGFPSKRQSSGKPLPPFQRSKYQLKVPVENPVGMSSVQRSVDLCSSQEGSYGDIPQTGSTDKLWFEPGNLELSDDDIINEVVIGDASDSMDQPSWNPLPRIQGCQETLLQPQVFDLHGQPLKLDPSRCSDPGSTISSIEHTISPQISFDLSKTFPENSTAKCLNMSSTINSDSGTLSASEGESDVIVVSSPRNQSRSPVETKVCTYKNGCKPEDSKHIAISDSDDDDLIEVSAPDSFAHVNRTRNFKPSLPTGTQIRTVPNGNGGYYRVLVVLPNQCSQGS